MRVLSTSQSPGSPVSTALSQLPSLTPPVEDCTLLSVGLLQRLLWGQPSGRHSGEHFRYDASLVDLANGRIRVSGMANVRGPGCHVLHERILRGHAAARASR